MMLCKWTRWLPLENPPHRQPKVNHQQAILLQQVGHLPPTQAAQTVHHRPNRSPQHSVASSSDRIQSILPSACGSASTASCSFCPLVSLPHRLTIVLVTLHSSKVSQSFSTTMDSQSLASS